MWAISELFILSSLSASHQSQAGLVGFDYLLDRTRIRTDSRKYRPVGVLVMASETDQQFWPVFNELLSVDPTGNLAELDGALIQSLEMIGSDLAGYLSDEESLHHAVSTLLHSPLFLNHSQRVTNSIILILIDPSTPLSLIFVACLVLLLNGFENAIFFRTLRTINLSALSETNSSSPISHPSPSAELSQLIPVLLAIGTRVGLVPSSFIDTLSNHSHLNLYPPDSSPDLSSTGSANERYAERKLGPLLSGLLYELCRVQKLEDATLELFSEQLIDNLFQLVELTRDQEDETFNYNLIKLIIALNEQFMLAGLNPQSQQQIHNAPSHHHHRRKGPRTSDVESNIIIRTMKHRLDESKTFGENLIFILNRASHSTSEGLCVSLLILKILYLLFTTPGTHEYFYTNDLCVLVDIFIRELSDLPDESNDLRHTYLRVLHPLLTQTQLRSYHYKREEVRHVLLSHIKYAHLQDINATTKRLVERNLHSDWCLDLERTARSLNRPGLAGLSCERSLSVETLGSQLSGGGSMAEVITSNTDSIPITQPSSSTVLLVTHHQLPPSSSPAKLQAQTPAIHNPSYTTPQGLRSSVVLNNLSHAFVQVTIADSSDCYEETQAIHPIASSSYPPEMINRPASIISARSISPNSDGSLRPSSSCSVSRSPARRPAPKPPTSKRKGPLGTHLSPDPNSEGPSTCGSEIPIVDEPEPETSRRASIPSPDSLLNPSTSSQKHRSHPIDLTKHIRRAAPTPPQLSSPSSYPDETPPIQIISTNAARRRKAPLPPKEAFSKLRSSKSSSHLPLTPTLLPSASPSSSSSHTAWKPSHTRVVSLSSDQPIPPANHPSYRDKRDNNPFGE
ncbi:hypothetical protein MJO29_000724 [Puccinia striiformis f. sp. tritici]|uniref:hypothetical protein n=1 Tax=Puccinia striiformis f. sp. tritici TaxID=168172 RepID=UPI002007A21D|nr:hypothetical protein Pst134EA_000736 [Puccinia striiformis f. sp. tritici]KAH9473657.1 hypothetical protein Pst134EA_000736 [Puccinia striiformis f. sp. tritici]KAI7967447.1 hypothetical protein MJO29_000724 [Puccinia striiformis f. sp. tritici]KAI9601046.1 hypothetical protein H4Q26_000844 [Puccinia striiformis f. sp. tritici PST-130]